MSNLQYPNRLRPVISLEAMPVVETPRGTFFAQDIEPLVLQACRARGIGFDLFATRFNVPRATLSEILRGNEPVTNYTRRILEDFVARTLGRDAAVARLATPPSGGPALS